MTVATATFTRKHHLMLLLSVVLSSVSLASFAAADASFDCKISISNTQFDLNPLKGLHSFTESTTTPPTITKTVYDISLCSSLPAPKDGTDSCPLGTYLCSTTLTSRSGLEDRVISVVPIAGEIGEGDLSPTASAIDGSKIGEKWELELKGGLYNGVKQSAKIEFICDKTAKETVPTLTSYDAAKGLLSLRWMSAAACPTSSDGTEPPAKDPKNDKGDSDGSKDGEGNASSGFGFFGISFIISICAGAAYFILGSYYNYSQYGATGLDMLPHRDLWQDLPYIIGDMFKGRGSSRSGYSALG